MPIPLPPNFDGSKFRAKYSLGDRDFWVSGNLLYCPSLPELTEADLADCVVTPEETAEQAASEQAYAEALPGYFALNGWWNDTPAQAATRVRNAVFGGRTLEDIDAEIDLLPGTVAGMRTGLHNAAAQIVAIRTLLTFIVRAIAFLRDYTIRRR